MFWKLNTQDIHIQAKKNASLTLMVVKPNSGECARTHWSNKIFNHMVIELL